MQTIGLRRLTQVSIALLVLAIGLMAVLLGQTRAAERAQRQTTQHALRKFAQMASVELATLLGGEMMGRQLTAFERVAAEQTRRGPGDPVPLDSLALLFHRHIVCDCTGPLYFVRLGYADSDVAVAPAAADEATLPPSLRRAVRVTLLSSLGPQTRREAGDSAVAPRGSEPLVARIPGMAFLPGPEGLLVLIFEVMRTADGTPVVAYGVLAPAEHFVAPAVSQLLDRYQLLPGMTGGVANDSLLAVRIETRGGRRVHVSNEALDADGTHVGSHALSARWGDLRVHVTLAPAVATRVLFGDLPPSRLPLFVALLAITLAVALVVGLLWYREHQLAASRAEFVAGVSHELRTPLAQIRLLGELLSLGKPASEAGRRRAAAIIDQEARRLAHLVENVLQFSTLQRGSVPLSPEPTELVDEVRRVLDTFQPLVRARGAVVQLSHEAPIDALVDRAALRQILLNLLDNALRYGPAGQTITVLVERHGDRARIRVRDQGPGIPWHERERIWEPYYRVQRPGSATDGGSGIGLSVVRDLVRRQGGSVTLADARSDVDGPDARGAGAEFVVEVPMAPQPARHAVDPLDLPEAAC